MEADILVKAAQKLKLESLLTGVPKLRSSVWRGTLEKLDAR